MGQVGACGKLTTFIMQRAYVCMLLYMFLFLREFIESKLIDFVKESPEVAVYMKPRRHRTPIIKAEYCKLTQL